MPVHQKPLPTPGGEATQGCGPQQEKGPKSGACVQARPDAAVILWVLLRSVMPVFSTRVLAAKAHRVGGRGLWRGVGISLVMAPSAGSRLGGGQSCDLGWP